MSNFNFLTDISPELAQFGKSAELYCHDDKQVALVKLREGANKQVISSQADSLIKISRIWADF
ncbi:hypothetical protein ABMY80_27150, partial [Klebsiella pneumoniae]